MVTPFKYSIFSGVGKFNKLMALHLVLWSFSPMTSAQDWPSDPFFEQLNTDCSENSWRGIKSLLILKLSYPNSDHSQCFGSSADSVRITPIGSVRSVHSWLLLKSALEHRNLTQASQLIKRFNPLLKPKVISTRSKRASPQQNIDHRLDIGMYCSAMFPQPSEYSFLWTLALKSPKKSLGISYRGQITLGINGKKYNLAPSQHLWIDDTILPISAPNKSVKITVHPSKNTCFMLRLDNQSKRLNLWEKLHQKLDKEPQSLSEDALLVLALIAQEAQIDESKRLLPIIETDQRWNKKPNLWLSQAFQSLSPPEIRAQAWGDYPSTVALSSELKGLTLDKHATKLTQFHLLTLNEFYDHLSNGRINKGRKLLDTLISQDKTKHFPWLEHRILIAENALDRYLGLNLRPLHRLSSSGSLDYILKHTPLILEYIQALAYLSTQEKVNFLQSNKFRSWLKLHLGQVDQLSPDLVQIITEFLIHSKADTKLWVQGLTRVIQGPIGLELARQLENLFTRNIQEALKRTLLDKVLYESFGLKSNSIINEHSAQLSQSGLINSTSQISPPPTPILGRKKPWLKPKLEQRHSQDLKISSVKLETVYQHIHYDLYQGRLRKIERRVLKPLNHHAARSLIKIVLPHSPSRQSFTINHTRHMRKKQELYKNITKVKRSQRSLSNPDERLYYDLIAEELQFENLRTDDLLDIQWAITELNPDPSFNLPHADMLILQDKSYKRCLLVTLDTQLRGRIKSDLVLNQLNKEHLQNFDSHCPQSKYIGSALVKLSHVPPLVQEESGLQGTSIYPYLHLSNLESWSTIVTLYKSMLDPLLKTTDLLIQQAKLWTKNVKTWNQTLSDRKRYERDALESLFLNITKNTRYVGLEFGRHSYEPALPDLTLERGLGDCKDRAALMIALARTLGIHLDFAMVRTRSAGRIKNDGLVSLSSFDHAAVYSPTLKRYFDPTLAHYDPKVLPRADYGAQALLVDTWDSLKSFTPEISLTTIQQPEFKDIGQIMKLGLSKTADDRTALLVKFELYGENAVKIREQYDEYGHEKLNKVLDQLFPTIALKQEQFTISKTEIHDRDPIRIHLSAPIFSGKKTALLPIKFAFAIAQTSSFNSSQRKQALHVPQSRHIKCIERSQLNLTLEKQVLNSLKSIKKAPVLGWSINYFQRPQEICFQVQIQSKEVLASEYKKVYHWLHETEVQLNQGLKILTESYLKESEAHD
ncbi:MAG: hypothetical protein CL916_12060 [Deltaproteobacteria bacterium]|nr:hypothetical protein [Deltaproteobacteria bacterium]